MKRLVLSFFLVLLGGGWLVASAAAWGAEPDAGRRAELTRLVRQDCGSCHGLTLKGGLGPALLPGVLAGKDRNALVATVLYGRSGTAMPPWRDFVSEDEAEWMVDRLLEGFPLER